MFARRIVGLQLGNIVYDGPPDELSAEVLTQIYGAEDWESTIEATKDLDEDEADVLAVAEKITHKPGAAS
jgi:phosphonate transport system ATP-binding protein